MNADAYGDALNAACAEITRLSADNARLREALRGLMRHIGAPAIFQDIPEFNAARTALSEQPKDDTALRKLARLSEEMGEEL